MSTYVLDTNIIFLAARSLNFQAHLEDRFELFTPDVTKVISIVTTGELSVIAPKHTTGEKRLKRYNNILEFITVVPISDDIVDLYVEIDLFSQNKHPTKKTPRLPPPHGQKRPLDRRYRRILPGSPDHPDKDFNHLNGVFLTVHYVDQQIAL